MASKRIDTGILKRGNTYTFTVALGLDYQGKQIRKTTTYVPPENISERKADNLAKEEYLNFKNRCKGLTTYNENMKFSELCEDYFKLYAPNKLKPITAYNYEKAVTYHFLDYFGNKKLKEITTGMLSDFFCSMTRTNEAGEVIQLAPSTVKRIYNIMQSIFHFAMSQRIIRDNPCKDVILPKKDVTKEAKRKYLLEDEIPRFLDLFEGYSSLNTIVKLLLLTGMRAGEALGLKWSDVDFENKVIHVNHTLTDVGGKLFLTTPKTRTSKRTIYMNSTVIQLLKEHKKKQHELIFSIGSSFAHPEMVFTSKYGNYKDRAVLNTSLRRFLKGTEFKFMTLHCLRHSNATLLLNSGVDLKIVSEHLGHSEVGTTADIYTDVLDISRRKTAEIIELKLGS